MACFLWHLEVFRFPLPESIKNVLKVGPTLTKLSGSAHACERCFSQISNLNNCKRIHTGEKPFTCPDCGKSFCHYSNFKRHKEIHTGIKPYTCETCRKSFSQESYLIKHTRVHTGIKPYDCYECGKSFSRETNLKRHQMRHARETYMSWMDQEGETVGSDSP